MSLERLLHELKRRSLVPLPGDEALEDLAFLVDSAPQIAHLAIHLHVDLVEVPAPVTEAAHVADPLTADVCCEQRTKPVPPEADSFVADIDTALVKQIFDVSQRQRVFQVHQHRQADHLRRRIEAAEWRCGLAKMGHEVPLAPPA